VAGLHDGNDLGFVFRQHHHHRQLAVRRQTIAFVRTGIFFVEQDAVRRDDALERRDDFALSGRSEQGCCWRIHAGPRLALGWRMAAFVRREQIRQPDIGCRLPVSVRSRSARAGLSAGVYLPPALQVSPITRKGNAVSMPEV